MKKKMTPSATLKILRILAEDGVVDYRDGNVCCTWNRFCEAIGELGDKTGVCIVNLGSGKYSVTKENQRKLKLQAGANAHRDVFFPFGQGHPRWKQLKTASQKGKPCDYDYTRLALIIIGALLAAYGLVSLYFLPTY